MKKHLLTLAVAAAAVSTAAFAGNPTVYGVFGNTSFSKTTGAYRFQPDSPSAAEECYTYTGFTPYTGGAVFMDDKVVYIEPFTSYTKPILKVYRFEDIDDNNTWSRDPWVENLPNSSATTCLALDPLSNNVYGIFYNEDKTTFFFGTLDPETGLSTKIRDVDFGSRAISLAFNDMGVAYIICANGKFYRGNNTGLFTEVGTLSNRPSPTTTYCMASVIDPADNTFYWTVNSSNDGYILCTVDVETCEVTKIASMTDLRLACALMIPASAPAENAPAAITDLNVSAEGFSTDLTVSFTVPDHTVGGTAISAGLSAYVAVDGEIFEDGSVVGPGNTFSKTYTVTDGPHTIAAWVTTRGNDPVASQKVAAQFFAGQDTPSAVSGLDAVKSTDAVTLTWTAPTVGANGGNFDRDALTYTVNLVGNDKGEEDTQLAAGLTECTYTYTLGNSDLRFLQFEVVPVAGSVTGKSSRTDVIVVGEDFPGAVLDLAAAVNEDGNVVLTWEAPVEGANGSDFDAASLTYNVKLVGVEEPVAQGLTATTYTYVVEGSEMRALQFEVTPVTRKGEGASVQSEKLVVGDAYAVPYFEDFEDKTLDETFFTIINANDDAKYWNIYSTYSNTTLRITYTSSNGVYQDDWAITPPIQLSAGSTYVLAFDALLSNPGWGTENLEVFVGTAPTVEGMIGKLGEYEYSVASNKSKAAFQVEADGQYFIGFHCVSPGNHGNLDLDNISLDRGPAVPAASPEFTASVGGKLVALDFVVPSVDAEGGSNPGIEKAELTLNGQLIKTFSEEDLADTNDEGKIHWLDYEEKEDGKYTYSLTFHNIAGASEPAVVTVKVGTVPEILFEGDAVAENVTYRSADITFSYVVEDAPEGASAVAVVSVGSQSFDVDIEIGEGVLTHTEALTYLDAATEYTCTVALKLFAHAADDTEAQLLDETDALTVQFTTAAAPAVSIVEAEAENVTHNSADIVVEYAVENAPEGTSAWVILTDAATREDKKVEASLDDNGRGSVTFGLTGLAPESENQYMVAVQLEDADGNIIGAARAVSYVTVTTAAEPTVTINGIERENLTDSSVDLVVSFVVENMPEDAVIAAEAAEGDNTYKADNMTDDLGNSVATIPVTGLEKGTGYTFTVVVRATKGLFGDTLAEASDEVSLVTSGVDSLGTENSNVRYFNIRGIEVENPETGIYIKVEGNCASKVGVK